MVGFVLAIGLINLALGAAAAHYLLPPRQPRPRASAPSPPPPPEIAASPPPAPEQPAAPPAEQGESPVVAIAEPSSPAVCEPPPLPEVPSPAPETPEPEIEIPPRAIAPDADVPREWLDKLEESLVTGTFLEAAIQVLRLEVGKYRARLVELEDELEALGDPPAAEVLSGWAQRLAEANAAWLGQQSDAAAHLRNRQTDVTRGSNLATALETTLLLQAAQIETTLNNLKLIDVAADPKAACRKLLAELRRLLDLAHTLRDQMHASLANVLDSDGALAGCDPRLLTDSLTGFRSRAGLAAMLREWLAADPGRTRLASAALLDLDRFGRANEQHGTRLADDLLRAVATLLDGHTRRDRGFDVLARYAGQQFLLFFGDTGPRQATAACERFRQAVEATTFEAGSAEITLTATAGVAEFRGRETIEELFERLERCLGAAKSAGRNRSFLDEGNGPAPVDPPEFTVKARVVRIRG